MATVNRTSQPSLRRLLSRPFSNIFHGGSKALQAPNAKASAVESSQGEADAEMEPMVPDTNVRRPRGIQRVDKRQGTLIAVGVLTGIVASAVVVSLLQQRRWQAVQAAISNRRLDN